MQTGAGAKPEQCLLDYLSKNTANRSARALFVLGAPRTGSTVLYQALSSRFGLPYIANLTNEHFAHTPIVGLAIQKSAPVEIAFSSRYGKTHGPLQPSEGSAVLAHWFGGGHPSALVSNSIKDGMEDHFLATLAAAETLFGLPLVIKNPWNCFRVRSIAEALPEARFAWLRRDPGAAAKSDLACRYVIQGSPTAWNSATPANVEELRRLPPAQQVVENQRAFNAAISDGLKAHAAGRWAQVWYEDFCRDPEGVLDDLGNSLGMPPPIGGAPVELTSAGNWELPSADEAAIDAYTAQHQLRHEA